MVERSHVVQFLPSLYMVGVDIEQRRNRFRKGENEVAQSILSCGTLAKHDIKGALHFRNKQFICFIWRTNFNCKRYIASNERRENY
jgi:hypothetical protein